MIYTNTSLGEHLSDKVSVPTPLIMVSLSGLALCLHHMSPYILPIHLSTCAGVYTFTHVSVERKSAGDDDLCWKHSREMYE
jgi:hypothetical protein